MPRLTLAPMLLVMLPVAAEVTEKPAEQAFRNIQVLKGLPESQLISTMFFICASLHHSCDHCHDETAFEKDEKPAKLMARRMMRMVKELNDMQFGGRQMISCNTCHRGELRPSAPLPFAAILSSPPKSGGEASPQPLPTASELFRRHVQSVGGESAVARITSRRMWGTRTSSEGWRAAIEIRQRAPNQWISRFKLQSEFVSAYDGAHGWNADDQGVHDTGGRDLGEVRQDAEFYRDTSLQKMFTDASTSRRERLNGRDAWVVHATSAIDGGAKELYFDTETGLLVRIAGSNPAAFGPLPNAVDYDDYREVDGVKAPFTIRHLRPDFSTVDTFAGVEQNAPIGAQAFEKPRIAVGAK